jgi:fimbrial chaperone protein
MYLISKFHRFTCLILEGLALVCVVLPAQGAVTITPVIIDVAADGRAVVTVRNDRPREVLYQITVLKWRLVDGVDRYEATQDFIASPPLFTLASAASQIVRIGFRNPAPLAVEQSYRLVLAEVPRPGDTVESGVVEFAMQYLIPVFVASNNHDDKPKLLWQIRAESGMLVLRADNLSQSRIVLNMVGLTSQPGSAPTTEFANKQKATVLANSWREWRIPVPKEKLQLPWRIVVLQGDSATALIVPDADMRPPSTR